MLGIHVTIQVASTQNISALGTHQDNMKDKSVRKRVHGEKNPNAKYTDKQRELAKTSTGSPKKVAEELGMSVPHVCNLRKAHHMVKFQ